ncbi:4Fe-4S dicluster domain-containing protein [bacterium]|nr:4Fe-4S dicluster domain-containing protein [bacterium]MCB2179376.1 4Fe-4S dicluster domain-containing protein [bacterium]
MTDLRLDLNNEVVIKKAEFNQLLFALQKLGFTTLGPQVKHEVVEYGPIDKLDDLPQGYTSVQEAGSYRLKKGVHNRYFDITPGAQSWKQYIYPPRKKLFTMHKDNGTWERVEDDTEVPKFAFIGVRPCELAAINILDHILIRNDFQDSDYAARRSRLFILAVDCTAPGDTCFCVSMGTGPEAEKGYDLKLTELEDSFLIRIGSDIGLALMRELTWEPATAFVQQAAQRAIEKAIRSMGRHIRDAESLPDVLLNNLEHEYWMDVADRCMSCGNCTFVCPTCFCWDALDEVSVTTEETSRVRVWDSCFNLAYSAQAGGNTRPSTKSRYRQWLSHKFGNWQKQFGMLGCVGCGRCITWCPAGIDVTAEVRVFQEVASS